MHILITDSGVGGLSVVAYAERFVRTRGSAEPVRLTFANAAPANDHGYNAMPTLEAKLETFDRFLTNAGARSEPDSIYVACNTLSVLLDDTPFVRKGGIPVRGIVETGVDLVARELQRSPQSGAMIFGTQTTIDAGAYPRLLVERGIDPARIVDQACPGLADTISEDREGSRSREEIARWVGAAIGKMSGDGPVVACLACTHYGYRRKFFEQALAEAGICATVVDPNERAVDDLFGGALAPGRNHDVEVEFVTRYAIPEATIEALTWFLGEISPRTVAAMRNFVLIPDLF
ncbi:MAG TPA: aspartate/glutamate racemase family protein [Thermoanaerobaculia bacterium]|nr:aspartate/glutamate racemase family protein [Thermoanaerobaculia bacterium]